MTRPRVTLRRLMLLVALLALTCWVWSRGEYHATTIGTAGDWIWEGAASWGPLYLTFVVQWGPTRICGGPGIIYWRGP